jgi:hypothetical protein
VSRADSRKWPYVAPFVAPSIERSRFTEIIQYQFVSRALIPNTQQDYKRLGDVVKNGRRAGLIDWEAIEDARATCAGALHGTAQPGL